MSAAVVTGAVALYLQKYPQATNEQIRAALLGNTTQDKFTTALGSLPNRYWGYGKLNIFKALTGDAIPTSIALESQNWPTTCVLFQNHPNPFNPQTQIEFHLTEPTRVSLVIYDLLGRKVRTLISNRVLKGGDHHIPWDATNNRGESTSSGMYLYKLTTETLSLSKKMVLLR